VRERDARVCEDRKRPGRRVRVAERLDGGDATSARSFARKEGGERAGEGSVDFSRRREGRGGVLVAGDTATAEIVGGAELGTTAAMAAHGSSVRGGGWCPRVPRGARGSRHGLYSPGNLGVEGSRWRTRGG